MPWNWYENLLRPLLFQLEPETAHRVVECFLRIPWLVDCLALPYRVVDRRLERRCFGLTFPNPVGLAAGFDKNATMVAGLARLGFGFLEIGTVTPRPQSGNPRPRLFRLPRDQALINRMGFNNDGADRIAKRLSRKPAGVVIGANIGKNRDTPLARVAEDYLYCLQRLHSRVDYFVVNVSSPNTPGLRALQTPESLAKILEALQQCPEQQTHPRPLLVKIAPELSPAELQDLVTVCLEMQVAGLVATNTTTARKGLRTPEKELAHIGEGGLSGLPLRERATEILYQLHQLAGERLAFIGVGGIFSARDALEKFAAGACLVQIYTGFVYRGPALIREINQALLAHPVNAPC